MDCKSACFKEQLPVNENKTKNIINNKKVRTQKRGKKKLDINKFGLYLNVFIAHY